MAELNYEIKRVIIEKKKLKIGDDAFICVKHYIDGRTMYTAFIGKGEGKEKHMITFSSMGGIFKIEEMHGSADLNASCLLSESERNEIVSKSEFKYWNEVNMHFVDFVKSLA